MNDLSDISSVETTLPRAASRKRRIGRMVALLLVLALIGGVAYTLIAQSPQRPGFGGPGGGGRFAGRNAEAPVSVLAATARAADVPVYLDGVGTIKALNTVTVRPQVSGKLMRLNFKEGQDVAQGFVLAEIDDATYKAQLYQTIAKKAQDEAQLANARIDLERYDRLAKTNSGTKQQADTQRALVAQYEALVNYDQATIDNARAFLDYTKVTAPIAGRTGIRQVDAGNVIQTTDTSGIVVITQLQPISVFFTLPQQQLAQVNKAFTAGPLRVEALGPDNKTAADRGVLQVVDNQVDQTTGTVKLKAEFPNPDLALWPGQFVNIRLLVDTLKQVIVVPTAAVQRGPNGTFAYVIKPDSTVTVRPVAVGQQDDKDAVIARGLTAGEQVVTTGFTQLSDGSRVTIGTPEQIERTPGSERQRPPQRGPRPPGVAQGEPPAAAQNAPSATGQNAPPDGTQNGPRGQRRGERTNGAAPQTEGAGGNPP